MTPSVIQSILFDKLKFTPIQCAQWLHLNGYKYKKMDEKPHFYRFRQVSPQTVRKKGLTHFITKRLGNTGIELIIAYPTELKGGFIYPTTITDSLSYLTNYITGKRSYPKAVESFLKKHGNEVITDLVVEREPLGAVLPTLLNWLSLGTFKQNVKNADYDKLFHLSIDVKTNKGTFCKIEKNEEMTITTSRREGAGAEFIQCPVPHNTTIKDFLENGRKYTGDDNFFVYSAKDRNCQRFILDLLMGNGILTEKVKNFVYQDTEKIFENLDYLRRIANTSTDLAVLLKGVTGIGGSRRHRRNPDIGIF